jgi:type I restriction enzyme S subunit
VKDVPQLERTLNVTTYQDSGVEWLNLVPARWNLVPLFTIAQERNSSNKRGEETNVLSLSYGRIIRRDLSENYGLMPESFDTYQIVDRGNIVLRLTDLQNDKRSLRVGLVEERGIVSSAYVVLTVTVQVTPRYLFYLLHAYDVTKIFYTLGAGVRQAMTYQDLRRMPILVPPTTEQRTIARYLDRETARMDAMVVAKERLLGLLAEKRRAFIISAVTRGLDSRAPSHDSGIPWLGEIPAHWRIWKVRHFAKVGNGSTPSRENADYWTDGIIPWLNSSVVNQDEVTGADQFVTEIAFRDCHLPLVKRGSVLVGITGQGKTRGQAVVLSIEATINQHLAFVTPENRQANSWFLRWVFFAAYEYLRSISDAAGGTKGALTCEEVAALRVPLPPLKEQRAIVAQIMTETTKLDAMRSATERTVALLKERRAALIAAAVTGEIDVRESAHLSRGGLDN